MHIPFHFNIFYSKADCQIFLCCFSFPILSSCAAIYFIIRLLTSVNFSKPSKIAIFSCHRIYHLGNKRIISLVHWRRRNAVSRFFHHFIGGVRCQNGKKTVLIAVLHHIAFSVNGNGKSVNEENGTDGIWLSVSIAKLLAFFVTVSFWISCRKEYRYV